MKVLELDVNSVKYELLKPEAKVYDKDAEKKGEVSDALLVLISVEEGDGDISVERAVSDIKSRSAQLGRKRVVLYPFAHLSNMLADPQAALDILEKMKKGCAKAGLEVKAAPFGWNKKLSIDVKGHPYAEQGRSYSESGVEQKKKKKPKVNLSIVKKSDWSGLPDTDHRTIGEKLDLYSFQEVSPGMVYWHNNGYIIFKELFRYIREKLDEYGYQEISTPALANLALWHVSGHIEHYRDDMFTFESESSEMGLKPMNCPSTVLIYKSRKWSYRDLPVRFADFDKLYRNEISGALTGLFRVREITQDDAHIFVREDQIEEELVTLLRMIKELYQMFGLKYKAKLSTMPDSHMGDEALWDRATKALEKALKKNKMEFGLKEKDGAFYGPKIDFDVQDSMGREWQCATVQLDYQQPKRFGLSYTGEDGKEHEPVMIHRVIYGSLERFIGILVEHLQGRFPTWMAPEQVRIITISNEVNEYAEKVYKKLRAGGIRVGLDLGDKTMQYKIRDAQMQRIPYMVVVGKKEEEAQTIAVRDRNNKQKFGLKLADFEEKLKREISQRDEKSGVE